MTSAPTLAPMADQVQPRVSPPPQPFRMRRLLVVVLLVLAFLIPYGVTMALFWSNLSDRLTVAQRERDAVAYLSPLVRLLSATADVQSVTVAGGRPDTTEIRAAIGAVDTVDNRLGAELSTQARWSDLSNRLDALLQAPPSGQAAYTNFTQVVDLEAALITSVGDSGDLILDPQLDSFYVIDATLARVPAILISAGRANDLGRLPGPTASLAPAVAVAAEDVRVESAAIDVGFRKSFAVTQTGLLGPGLLSALDRLGDAVTALVPPTAGVGTVADRSARVLAARARVRDAALALEVAGLAQLDQALSARVDSLLAQRRLVLEAAAVGGLLAVAALLLAMPRRRRAEDVAAVPWTPEPGMDQPSSRAGPSPADRSPFDDRGGGRTRPTAPVENAREMQ